MQTFTATTTQRNSVTIPAEVRRVLGLKPRDQVTFTIEDDGTVRLTRSPFTLQSAFGSVEPARGPRDLDALIRDAKDEKMEQTVRELRDARS